MFLQLFVRSRCGNRIAGVGIFAALLLLISTIQASADSIIVPYKYARVESTYANSFPFNIGAVDDLTSMRYQQVFDASRFSTAFNDDAKLITGVNFRPDRGYGESFNATTLDVLIRLSTTSREPDALSEVFAENIGSDETTVLDGSLTLSSADEDADGVMDGPRKFDISINFSSAFTYDPGEGNLLFDVINNTNSSTTLFDAVQSSTDSVSRVYSDDADDTSGTFGASPGTRGLVAQFVYTDASMPRVVPTPTAAWAGLIGFSLLTLSAGLRGRRTGPPHMAIR